MAMQQSQYNVQQISVEHSYATTTVDRIQTEFVRKSLHLLIALVPMLAAVNLMATLALVAAGTIFYAFAELSRLSGIPVPVVSDITLLASRARDRHGFVLGPVTLGIGAMLSLVLYPSPAAAIAIYALAFGDGFASLVGTVVRGPKLPFLRGKTWSGSLACFAAVFVAALCVTARPVDALVIAACAAVLEAVPTGNFDNIILPFGVGMIAAQVLGL
jgi:phytol kinase